MRYQRGFVVFVMAVAACSTSRPHEHAAPAPSGAPPPLFSDLGTHHHPVSCSTQAQPYFDQGLRLVYAFNHDEAMRAFKQAAQLDPNCAMAYWGIALALGPNINLPLDSPRAAAAHDAITQAQVLAPRAAPAEQAYIAALAKRYAQQPDTADRSALDRAYADAMRDVAHQYPDDNDAATLFAESLMDLHPWAYWTPDGQPRPDTAEIVATLEAVLQKEPDHPGANHYYIHAIEASRNPERGLPSAERLGGLMPGAGHLVHMPSHIYIRTGRYSEAADANRKAIAADEKYLAAVQPDGVYAMMYYPHNIHFLSASASMDGRSAEAVEAARTLQSKVTPAMAHEMPMVEYFMPWPYFTLARFGRWQELLDEPAPPADLLYVSAMWHYARGVALAGTNQFDAAQHEHDELSALAAQIPGDRIVGDNQQAGPLLRVASLSLAGEIAARQGQCETALPKLEEAVSVQDALPYMEPPPWYYPIRQTLGAVLLQCGRTDAAAAVFREDLARNPGNGWSLYGLAQAQRASHQPSAQTEAQFREAWRDADVKLTSSRF